MTTEQTQSTCTSCAAPLPPGATYCPACGKKVTSGGKRNGPILAGQTLRSKVAIAVLLLVLLYCYYVLVDAVALRMEIAKHEVSTILVLQGVLAASMAKSRRVLWFFVGCLSSLPLMFLASMLGGFLR